MTTHDDGEGPVERPVRPDADENPIQASLKYLTQVGWTMAEAKNLMRAVKSDKSAEHLWETAPIWIEHCAEIKRQMTLLETVAIGCVNVRRGDDDWLYSLAVDKPSDAQQQGTDIWSGMY